MQWDLGVFNFCLNYLLKGMAEARATKHGRFVPHRSIISPPSPPQFHGIYVRPLSRRFETRWTTDPLSDLYEIETCNYPFGKTINFPKPDSFLIPKDRRYRVFLFSSESKVKRYILNDGHKVALSRTRDTRASLLNTTMLRATPLFPT